MVTDRMRPLRVQDRTVHQVWVPYHWGYDRAGHRRLGERPVRRRARPQRADPGDKVATCDVRRPAGGRAGRSCWRSWTGTGGGPASPPATGTMLATTGPDAGRPHVETAHDPSDRGRGPVSEREGSEHSLYGPLDDVAGEAGHRRPPAADGVLHRHLGLHRLQGLRGGLQGVEPRPRRRVRPARHVVRQHRRLSARTLAARRVHRAAAADRASRRGGHASTSAMPSFDLPGARHRRRDAGRTSAG